jgi:hypothetical protein
MWALPSNISRLFCIYCPLNSIHRRYMIYWSHHNNEIVDIRCCRQCEHSVRISMWPFPLSQPPPHPPRPPITTTLCGYTALLLDLCRFSVSWSFSQSVGFLGWRISSSQGSYLHIGQHNHRINAHRYPCLEWDSNPRSQRSSERRQFMP